MAERTCDLQHADKPGLSLCAHRGAWRAAAVGGGAVLRRLACLVDQAQPLGWAWCRAVGLQRGSKRLRWERRRAWLYPSALLARRQRCEALV